MPSIAEQAATTLAAGRSSGTLMSDLPEAIRPQSRAEAEAIQDVLAATQGVYGWKIGPTKQPTDLPLASVLLGGSSLTFGGLGAIVSGKTLTFTEAASGVYAFRLLGDYSADTSFLALLGATHINGGGATYAYDGTYTTVLAAVPEPGTYAMLVAGLGLMGVMARRRRTKV